MLTLGRELNEDQVRQLTYSLIRNAGSPLQAVTYQGEPHRMQMWWGPVFELRDGDKLHGFATPYGLAIESHESG